ncbi:dihydrolipoyl dehydrogenase family protein [Luteipulveratus flavus]|uniref:NAD(P)/FAD-dependent oxidoreductase n=1 Tax=Luteipulveratus flavus TaxID=3031728 RepID=A0ABT6CCU9_9MICO|nr:NAD(P)/FAD-dependent oxidoreductase [Luteipulveratus sp. YIM 133296]MDF8266112.1 NAD(P)/FAD-dependent oxidoreductase [Luteipulveratus sp. YIM 133296]
MTSTDSPDQSDTEDAYDVIVVGAGPVGENLAGRTAAAGLRTVIVESELVGGECSYWACMPSKTLLRSGHALRAAERVAGSAEAVRGPLDVEKVLRRRDEFIHDLDDSSQVEWVEDAGITLVRGVGRLVGERTVAVRDRDGSGERVLTARQAVALATGSRANLPPLDGLDDVAPWTSREITNAKAAPRRLVIVGGGVVAVEMAQAWSWLGSEVTLVVRGQAVLERNEPFVGEAVLAALRNDGITVLLGRESTSVTRDGDGPRTLTLDDGSTLTCDELVIATGRKPRTDDLGLDVVGLKDGDYVEVDDTLRTPGTPWLYAVGDVNGRALLTHQGKYQARIASDAIVARARGEEVPYTAVADHRAVPQVVFTDPEVAAVGLTLQEAKDAGRSCRMVEYDLGSVAGAAVQADGYTGKVALVVDEDAQTVIGATFVGQDVAEMLQAATIVVAAEVPLSALRHAVPAYPTMSEVWLRLMEELGQ